MGEESGGLEGIGKTIPSLYWDIIARVCPGAPFLVVLLWDHRERFGEMTWAKLAMLAAAGYIVGLVLTSLSLPFSRVQKALRDRIHPTQWNADILPSLTDRIATINKDAAQTLEKMQAEMVLAQNLFTGFLLLMIVNFWFPLTLLERLPPACRYLVLIALAATAIHRIVAFVRRENGLYNIYAQTPELRPYLRSETNIIAVEKQSAASATQKAE